jgi:hypothetical protein
MVRAQPEKKVQSDGKKGTEPRSKEKKNTGNTDSPSARKKYFKELPGGILPKNGNPKPDDVNDEAKLLLEYEKQLQRNTQREFIPHYKPYPERRTYGIKSPANAPPTEGKGNDPPYGSYLKGMCVWMILFSVFMTFIISPWTALAWVVLQTVSFLSLNEYRRKARDFSMQAVTHIVDLAYHKVHSVRNSDIPKGGEQGSYTSTPECLKLNVTAKGKYHSHMQRKLSRQDAPWNKDTGLLPKISVVSHKDGREWLYAGPIDDPLGRIPVLVSNCSVHCKARRTSLEGKRGSAPSQDSEEENPEGRHNGVDRPEASAPWTAEPVLETPPAPGKQNSKGPKVKTDSCGPPKKTKKQSSLASPPKQKVKKPSERKPLQPQAARQEPLMNEAKASEVQDRIQAHLRWRSALFENPNLVGSTNPGKEFQQFLSFPYPIPSLSNVLERPVKTTKIDNAIWKYTIGQSVIL